MTRRHTFTVVVETDQDAEMARGYLNRFITDGVNAAAEAVGQDPAGDLIVTGPFHVRSVEVPT